MEPKWSIVPCERTDLVAALSPQGLRLKFAQELGAGPSQISCFLLGSGCICLDGTRQLSKKLFNFLNLEHRVQAWQWLRCLAFLCLQRSCCLMSQPPVWTVWLQIRSSSSWQSWLAGTALWSSPSTSPALSSSRWGWCLIPAQLVRGICVLGWDLPACVCAKSLQSCPTLCDPMDCSPPGSSVHGNSPGKTTGVRCCSLLQEIFPTQGLNPRLLHLPSLAGRFFTTSRDLPKPEQLKPIALDLGRAEVGTYHKVLKQLPHSRQLLCTSSFNPHHNTLRWVPVFSLYRGKEWDLEMIHNGANITVNKKLELAFMFY